MLTNVKYNEDEYEYPCLLVLGCFDAIHIGHAELLKKAKLQAKINGLDLGVMVFTNGKGGNQICTFEEKLALLENYNVKFVLSVDYTDDFKKTSPLDFLHNIEDKLNVKAYMSGKDFRFGAGAKGKSSTLKNYAEDEDNGVWYMPVKDVTDDSGEKISATKIKELIESGDVASANALLGREYSVTAEVIPSGETSKTLAYPVGKVLAKRGEYAVRCTVGETEYTGCATCGDNLELHIENLSALPAGEKVTVAFTACTDSAQEPVPVRNEPVEELAVTEEEDEPVPQEQPSEETEVEVAGAVEEQSHSEELLPDDDGFYDDYVEEQPVAPVVSGEELPAVNTENVNTENTENAESDEKGEPEITNEENID